MISIKLHATLLEMAYRKTGTRDPTKTGKLGPYENRETGTLKNPGIIYNSISFKIYKVNMKCKYFQKLEI